MAHSTDILLHEINPIVVVKLGWHSDPPLSPSHSLPPHL